jgi:molecular chaperone DnaK (HSP70)
MSRYVVGIDLGTTNSALAYVDTRQIEDDAPTAVRVLALPQVVGAGEVGARATLPSFLYLPAEKEFAPGALDLPWKSKAPGLVGVFARDHGAKVPGRLVGSAKSWLSHGGVDRRAPILPWTAAPDVEKVSPLQASAAYLAHLRDAFNQEVAGKTAADRLENQDLFLTVPASFDAVARELTVEAARMAGLEHVTLLEEPQAACYAWLAVKGEGWRKRLKVGDRLLVCDIGGGTTDFTLIAVAEEAGDLMLTREAVGEHILLGGDNMDLALAHAVAATLPGGMEGLDATQRVALTYACRAAKEALFSHPEKASAPVAVLG